jgi:hypothetical protein
MRKPKHIRTEPIKSSITGKRIGTEYIYDKKEMQAYREYKQQKAKKLKL